VLYRISWATTPFYSDRYSYQELVSWQTSAFRIPVTNPRKVFILLNISFLIVVAEVISPYLSVHCTVSYLPCIATDLQQLISVFILIAVMYILFVCVLLLITMCVFKLSHSNYCHLKNAFQLIPVRPEGWNLLGICWWDWYLPTFSLRLAPYLFNQLSLAIHWILQYFKGVCHLLDYLDDFFTAWPAASSICAGYLQAMFSLCNDIQAPTKLRSRAPPLQ